MGLDSTEASEGTQQPELSVQEAAQRAQDLAHQEYELSQLLKQDYDLRSSQIIPGINYRDTSPDPGVRQISNQTPKEGGEMFREYIRGAYGPVDFKAKYDVDTPYEVRITPQQPNPEGYKPGLRERIKRVKVVRTFNNYYVDDSGHSAKVLVTETTDQKNPFTEKNGPMTRTDFDRLERAINNLSKVAREQWPAS